MGRHQVWHQLTPLTPCVKVRVIHTPRSWCASLCLAKAHRPDTLCMALRARFPDEGIVSLAVSAELREFAARLRAV